MSININVERNAFGEVKIDSQIWMNKNYDFGGSYPSNSESTVTDYGKLYTWAEALAISFPGWHLPTVTELNTLQSYIGLNGGGHLKEIGTTYWDTPNTDADNSTSFSARGAENGTTAKLFARFWSSSESSSENAYGLVLSYNNNICGVSSVPKTDKCSIRLIKD